MKIWVRIVLTEKKLPWRATVTMEPNRTNRCEWFVTEDEAFNWAQNQIKKLKLENL